MQPINFNQAQSKLVPALRRLFHAPQLGLEADIWTILFNCGRERDALLYAGLFIPSFVEVEGSILYKQHSSDFEKKFSAALREAKFSLQELEASFNLLETSYIFNPGLMENLKDEDDFLFAQCVAEAWRSRLHFLYTSRKFQVSVVTHPESGDACAVTFHELRAS